MRKPRVITPPNRLAFAINTFGGDDPRQLIEEAGKRVLALRPTLRSYVSEKVAEILRFASASDDVLFAESRAIGAAALCVAEIAGAAGMETIGEIARGLSATVERLFSQGARHSDAIRLHIHALALASQTPSGQSAAEDRLMLDRLQIMRKVLGVAE